MNGELNKLFGRDFVIGFFVPALIFSAANFVLARFLRPDAQWLKIDWAKPFESAGLFLLATWIFAIFLQSINREIFRALEGYWPKKWMRRFNRDQRQRFQTLENQIKALSARKEELTAEEKLRLNTLRYERAMKFPSKDRLILPTSFGNVAAAYEDYPRVIYGFESIQGWARLQALMSKEFREILGSDRARVDLWLNLIVLSFLFAFELAFFARFKGPFVLSFVPVFLLGCWGAYVRARSSVRQYGEQVKAAFDLYLPALANQLGYVLSSDMDKNRRFWKAFRGVMLFRDSKHLREMAQAGLERVPCSAAAPVADPDEP